METIGKREIPTKMCDTARRGSKGWWGIWEMAYELQVKDLAWRWLEDEPQLWGGRRGARGEGIIAVMVSREASQPEAGVMEGCLR